MPNNPGVYFSYDNGATKSVYFWSQDTDNDDYRGDNPTDPFNQFTSDDQAHALNSVDLANIDAFGYNRAEASATPEPATLTLLGVSFACVAAFRFGRRKRAEELLA